MTCSRILTAPSQRVSSPISAQHLNAPVFVPKAPPFTSAPSFPLPHQTDLAPHYDPHYDLDPHTAAALQLDNLAMEHLVHLFLFLSSRLPYPLFYRTSALIHLRIPTMTQMPPPILAHLQTTTSTTEHPSRFLNPNNPTMFSSCEIPFGKNFNIERRIFGHQPLFLSLHQRKSTSITH